MWGVGLELSVGAEEARRGETWLSRKIDGQARERQPRARVSGKGVDWGQAEAFICGRRTGARWPSCGGAAGGSSPFLPGALRFFAQGCSFSAGLGLTLSTLSWCLWSLLSSNVNWVLAGVSSWAPPRCHSRVLRLRVSCFCPLEL